MDYTKFVEVIRLLLEKLPEGNWAISIVCLLTVVTACLWVLLDLLISKLKFWVTIRIENNKPDKHRRRCKR